jgi:hypothetical protein
MPSPARQCTIRLAVLVLAGLVLVHVGQGAALEGGGATLQAATPAKRTEQPAAAANTSKPLPAPVEEMRHAILAATQSGRIEDLIVPLDWNELKPDLAQGPVDDPIAFWKKSSADGEGREILAVLANILSLPPAERRLGSDVENNVVYVWPYLAEAKLDALAPTEEVDLLRLVSPDVAKAMRAKKKWTWWRLSIGADGTWHSFRKEE